MEFRILGRLEVVSDGRDVAPARAKTRALRGALLVNANQRLTADWISDALWGDDPPDTADKALQGHVSALRKLLGPTRILTERGGYRLDVRPGELDAERFSTALAAARATPVARDRSRKLTDAIAIWRGDALSDLADSPFAQPEIPRLEALRLAAPAEGGEGQPGAGRHARV